MQQTFGSLNKFLMNTFLSVDLFLERVIKVIQYKFILNTIFTFANCAMSFFPLS